jgi:hypothetical protein
VVRTFRTNTVIVQVDALPDEDSYDWAGPILSWVRGLLLGTMLTAATAGGYARLWLERVLSTPPSLPACAGDAAATWRASETSHRGPADRCRQVRGSGPCSLVSLWALASSHLSWWLRSRAEAKPTLAAPAGGPGSTAT